MVEWANGVTELLEILMEMIIAVGNDYFKAFVMTTKMKSSVGV